MSKAEESVGRVCRDRLRPVFMSLFNSRGEPIQFGSSQLLFPEWLRRVGLVGALIARSYICKTREDPGHTYTSLLLPPHSQYPSFQRLFAPFSSRNFLLSLYRGWDTGPCAGWVNTTTEFRLQPICFPLYYKSILLKSGLSNKITVSHS